MARARVIGLKVTDHAIGALADWNILPDDLYDMLRQGDYIVTRNRRGRAASHILIGYDAHGRCLAAPITPTYDPTEWRVITAWPCKPGEASTAPRVSRVIPTEEESRRKGRIVSAAPRFLAALGMTQRAHAAVDCDSEGTRMTEPIRYESLVPPRNEEERDLMDPESWDWSSSERGEPVPNPGAVLEVRFAREEFLTLARLAREEGIGPVEFLRRIALDRIAAASPRKRAS